MLGQEITDEDADLGTRLLMQEVTTDGHMRSLGMRQHLFEATGEGLGIEQLVLPAPDDHGRPSRFR